ncbi:YxeA family protein [Virgibacillus siamensis]|uniref:YxeA family protein n=1 Tax=Virgibacillus siamensis TaxID=480071 RepID=A0ABP3R4R0_9BACI
MKKLIGVFIGVVFIFILIVGYTFLPQSVTEVFDRGNPFISQKDVYVQIDKQPEKISHRYEYSLTGYTADGNEQNVNFTTSATLPKNTYLKVDAKGSYVKTWEEVEFHKLPSNVKENFKK